MQEKKLNDDFRIYFKCKNSEITSQEIINAMIMLEVVIDELRLNFLDGIAVEIKVKPLKKGSVELFVDFILNNQALTMAAGWVVGTYFKSLLGINDIEEYIKKQAKSDQCDIKNLIEDNLIDTKLFLKDYLKCFLIKSNDDLEPEIVKLSDKGINLDKSIKARSNFYQSALDDKSTEAISFGSEKDNLIYRDEFYKYIRDDIVRELPDIYEYKEYEIYKPVLKAKSRAKWGVIDTSNSLPASVEMKDKSFALEVIGGNSPLKTSSRPDIIKCSVLIKRQIKNGEEKVTKISVMQVFTFNNIIRIPLPEDFVINRTRVDLKPNNLFAYM